MAKNDGVHSLAEVQHAVSIDIETGMEARTALVAGCERFERFGFHEPWCGQGFFRRCIDEGVVVDGQEQNRHQAQALKHREPSSMAVILMLFLLFFSFGIR